VGAKTTKPASDFEEKRKQVLHTLSGSLLSISESLEIAEKREEEIDWETENEKLSLDIRKENRDVRQKWNKTLQVLVVVGFILSYLLILLIGFGVMKFDNNAFAVPSVVAAGVIQTYGLARLAIGYFFSEGDKTKPKKEK
jgi:hypothetical protein